MKRILILLAFSLSLAASAFAQAAMVELRTVDEIVADIEQKQGVTAPDQIKVDKVDPDGLVRARPREATWVPRDMYGI